MKRSLHRQNRSSGFTLIELMVALTLSAMLSIMIMMISTTAQTTYSETVQRVQIYNNFRFVMDQLRNDISNWLPSQELEFYVDNQNNQPRNFRFDPNEELRPRNKNPLVADGGTVGKYDEYAYIIQRHYKSVEENQIVVGNIDEKIHDAYQMYFRTMTYVKGQVREANVEYMLVDPSAPKRTWVDSRIPPPPQVVDPADVPNLSLYKISRFLEIDEKLVTTNSKEPPVDWEIREIATNVTDFRVEYLTRNPFSRSKRQGSPKFVTPERDYEDPAEAATRPIRLTKGLREARSYRKEFGYGSVFVQKKFDLATATPAKWGDQGLKNSGTRSEPVSFGFRNNPRIRFAELTAGDLIYVFTDASRGNPVGTAGSAARLAAFPSGTYTVKTNIQGMLQFVEDIDSTTWNDRDQTGVKYKAGFVPAAVRVTVRMVDDNGLNPKTMQQVVWLKRKSR